MEEAKGSGKAGSVGSYRTRNSVNTQDKAEWHVEKWPARYQLVSRNSNCSRFKLQFN